MSASIPLLSQTAEYALRAMACLALAPVGKFVRAEDLAGNTLIPRHYVSKILRRLVVGQLVEGKKGHHGGFRLSRTAEEITIADVLRVMDALPGTGCAFGHDACDDDAPCPLHASWADLRADFMDWMNRNTLASMKGVTP